MMPVPGNGHLKSRHVVLSTTERIQQITDGGSGKSMPKGQGGFAFDEETLRSMIKKWLTLADQYDTSSLQTDTEALDADRLAPGLDMASRAHSTAVLTSVRAYRAYLKKNREFCITQAQLLQVTLDDYLGQEHQRVRDFNDAEPQAGI
jgi:hypothetical protein